MTAGRPTSYEAKYAQLLIDYFDREPYSERDGKFKCSDYPSFAGFASSIGVHRDTLHEWCKVHKEFSDAYKRAKELQENWLLVNGLRGLIPPLFGMFTLKNNSGYKDKQPGEETVINNNIYTNMSDEELDKRIKENSEKLK